VSKRIFITGAAGLIGGEIASRLCEQGNSVTGLVHRNPELRSNADAVLPSQPWAAGAHRAGAVQTIGGDVSRAQFGWNDATWAAFATDHDLLIHSAATVRFDLSYEDCATVNVEGTRHALDLARLGAMPILHISTAYVCGTREGAINEVEPRDGAEFANSYEACKADAERLVQASGVPHAIARPSIVVGDSQTGAIRQFDTIYAALKLIAEGRVARMPARSDASLDFVPIDHVARGIVAIAGAMDKAAGGIFHLVANRALSIPDFFETLDGYDFFKRPVMIAPEAFDASVLTPLERRVFGRLLGPYVGYFQRSPRFNDDRLRDLTGLVCPPTGKDFFKILVDYCIGVGFLGEKAKA
jgi:2-alkyl-3-oxoalkanoate reductase